MSDEAEKPKNLRADVLPVDGYGLEVDGKVKSQHTTSEAAWKAGMALKSSFPVVQVMVFDAAKRTRTLIELPTEAAKA